MAKDDYSSNICAQEILKKRTLILGEVGSGKTHLMAKLLVGILSLTEPKDLTIVDMAPEKVGDVGGTLLSTVKISEKIRYLSPKKILAPRFLGESRKQVLEFANKNKEMIAPLLDAFIKDSTKILLINDITLYLHAGDIRKIFDCMELAETFLSSAYSGSYFSDDKGTGINDREKKAVEELMFHMDKVIRMNNYS